jgi:hypothetical protein
VVGEVLDKALLVAEEVVRGLPQVTGDGAVLDAKLIVEAGASVFLPKGSPSWAESRSEPTVSFYEENFLFMEKRDVVDVFFYHAGNVVRGLARLQNVVFLLQKEVGHGGFWFEPRRFGSWSMDLERALAALEWEGSGASRRRRGTCWP